MRKIFTIGETVYDIIFKGGSPQTAKPGGSMLNTAVSLGHLNLPVHLVSEYATDSIGQLINEFLNNNGVSTDFVHRYSDGKTPLALAFLNEQNNANYSFYKIYPEERLAVEFPTTGSGDIVLFGSIYSITQEIREKIMPFILASYNNNVTIFYDPNIRKTPEGISQDILFKVIENICLSTVVRASNEDCEALFGVKDGLSAYNKIKEAGCNILIYTTGGKEVQIFTEQYSDVYCLSKINTVSTIGAGDTFNAGLIYSFIRMGILKRQCQSVY